MATINNNTRASALTKQRLKNLVSDIMDLSESLGGGTLDETDGFELNADGQPVESVKVALFKIANEMRGEIENIREDMEDLHGYVRSAFGTDSDNATSQGPQGPVGATGAAGAKGDTGSTGPQGPQGHKVKKGDQGPKGDKGDKGNTGSQGPQGAAGAKGDTGAAGADGSDGAAGAKGDKGDKGDTGATGSAGADGSDGAKGDKGDKGDTGATGAAGADGSDGSDGAAGAKGDKGDKGDTGNTGAAGSDGSDGSDGAAGAKGDKGDTGNTGATGAAGADGSDGADANFASVGEHILPKTDGLYDIGSNTKEFRSLYLDGTANVDGLINSGTNVVGGKTGTQFVSSLIVGHILDATVNSHFVITASSGTIGGIIGNELNGEIVTVMCVSNMQTFKHQLNTAKSGYQFTGARARDIMCLGDTAIRFIYYVDPNAIKTGTGKWYRL